MSLINQVLDNVAARQGGLGEHAQQVGIAAVSPVVGSRSLQRMHRKSGLAWFWPGLVLIALAVLLAMLWLPSVTGASVADMQQTVMRWVKHVSTLSNVSTLSDVSKHTAAVGSQPTGAGSRAAILDSATQTAMTEPRALQHSPAVHSMMQRPDWMLQGRLERHLQSTWQSSEMPAPSNLTPGGLGASSAVIDTQRADSDSDERITSDPPKSSGTRKSAMREVPGLVVKNVKPEQEGNIWLQRALDHEQKGRLSEALSAARQALSFNAQSEDARLLLASYLFESKQEAEALQILQTGIQQQPESVQLRKSLAKWYLTHAQPEQSLAILKPVTSVSVQDADWQWMAAMAYQQTNRHHEALPYFEQAISLNPGQGQWVVAYAVSLQAVGQAALALKQLQAAQSLPISERLAEFVSQRIQQLEAVQ